MLNLYLQNRNNIVIAYFMLILQISVDLTSHTMGTVVNGHPFKYMVCVDNLIVYANYFSFYHLLLAHVQ